MSSTWQHSTTTATAAAATAAATLSWGDLNTVYNPINISGLSSLQISASIQQGEECIGGAGDQTRRRATLLNCLITLAGCLTAFCSVDEAPRARASDGNVKLTCRNTKRLSESSVE